MEILSIHLKTTKSTWLELYNVYLSNTSTQHNSFDPSLIKPGLSSLNLIDLNGHSKMWDPLQPPDLVVTKFLTGFSKMTYMFSMMALLLKQVESLLTRAP